MPIIPKTNLPYAEGTVPSYATQPGVPLDFGMQGAKAMGDLAKLGGDLMGLGARWVRIDAAVKESSDRMEMLKLQQEQEHFMVQESDWQKANPDSSADYMDRYREGLDSLHKDQQERYNKLSRSNREKLDLWRNDADFKFGRNTSAIQTQAYLTQSLNTGLGVVSEREDAGDFVGARIALDEVQNAGLLSNEAYEKRLSETNEKSAQRDFDQILADRESNLVELRGRLEAKNSDGTYSALTWTDSTGTETPLSYERRQGMVKALDAKMAQNARDARAAVMDSASDGSDALAALPAGSVTEEQRKGLEKAVSLRREAIAEQRKRASEKVAAEAAKAHKLAVERRQGAFVSEVYGTQFPSDLEARAERVEDLDRQASLVYADDPKGYQQAQKLIQSCAYPDARDENAALLQYYRLNYYDEKAGFGRFAKEEDFYAYDPDDTWWKPSDKDAEWVVQANLAAVDRHMAAYIQTTPGLTPKDVDDEYRRVMAVTRKTTVDQIFDRLNELARVNAPAVKSIKKR